MVWGETAVKPRPTVACRTAGHVSDNAPAQQLGIWVLAGGSGLLAAWCADCAGTAEVRYSTQQRPCLGHAANSRAVERYRRKTDPALIAYALPAIFLIVMIAQVWSAVQRHSLWLAWTGADQPQVVERCRRALPSCGQTVGGSITAQPQVPSPCAPHSAQSGRFPGSHSCPPSACPAPCFPPCAESG